MALEVARDLVMAKTIPPADLISKAIEIEKYLDDRDEYGPDPTHQQRALRGSGDFMGDAPRVPRRV